jgi:O-antigen/teichoic acid export membrane protein
MKKKLVKNLSANTIQLVVNQFFALAIFYVLSTQLDKTSFGEINLALAILLAVFNILSMGMDQLAVKKIASGVETHTVLSLCVFHVLITGLVFYGVLFASLFFFTNQAAVCSLVLLIGMGKLMIFFSTPFKMAANGMERFKLLAGMSVISNLYRGVFLIIFALMQVISLRNIVLIFITGDMLELLFGIYLFKRSVKTPINIKWNKAGYIQLLKEALPQGGVVVITSALARFDWIFIGLTLSAVKLAEYSFAYKVFEIATLPLLAIAPLLIPRFAKLFRQENATGDGLSFLLRIEIIAAAFVALWLNICWAPLIDYLTAGKYGRVNVETIFILSLCMPLLYINNFLWTIYFAKGQLKMILHSFIVTLLVNVAGDVVLIPLYKNEGAACAFLLACLAQTIFYVRKNSVPDLKGVWLSSIVCVGCALGSYVISRSFITNPWIAFPFSAVLYVGLLVLTLQLKPQDRQRFRLLLNG